MLGSLNVATQKSLLEKENNWYLHSNHFGRINSAADLQRYLSSNVTCLLSACPFDLDDKRFFVKGCGPGCASDSSKQENLFGLGGKEARCLNCACFHARLAKFRQWQIEELKKKHEIKKDLALVSEEHGYGSRNTVTIGSQKFSAPNLSYDEKIVKTKPEKGDPQPVYVVSKDGHKISLGYLVKDRAGGGRVGSAKPKKSPTAALADRKRILQSRRWDIVRKKLIDLVLASRAADVSVDVVDLVPIFGFGFNAAPLRTTKYDNKLWTRFDARKKAGFEMPKNEAQINYAICGNYLHHTIDRYSQRGTEKIKDRNEAIWHGLKHVMIDQLLHFRLVSEIIGDHGVTDIERIGKLLKFDTAKAKKEADLQIPPPKSWGKVDLHTLEPIKA